MTLRLMSAIGTSHSSTTQPTQPGDSAKKLLKQLLECVQECQKRFGAKTELATEFDSCVVGLCLTLESVLLHGLKSKVPTPQSNVSNHLRQVSGIVANSLHLGTGEISSFWPFVLKHLTKHEQERYSVLKHIWTDTGRGRAWIRSLLNERSLERYFHILLSNNSYLEHHYEDWALLRDQEKSAMLPNMAAGIGFILFAISIDKPELNSGASRQRLENLKAKTEPIVPVSIPERSKLPHKKRRKVARQFISFDEDDMLSTSVPSTTSSSSASSSTSEPNETRKTPPRHPQEVIKEATGETDDKSLNMRKLSLGSRDKFSSEAPESLTSVTHSEIGELTPVSVEFEPSLFTNASSGNSKDLNTSLILAAVEEVPTDISALMTAVEQRSTEEIQRKDDKIQVLTKENECLKDQVKKYVSAISMLQRDETGLQRALDGLQLEQQPDYKSEAKLFEQKLVQVAEMHAELMDFNVTLQQSLCQKDSLIETYQRELQALRGPMPSPSTDLFQRGSNVNVWIPSAFLTGTGSNAHHVYQIFLRAGSDEWNIYRRYAQFHVLHSDLKKLDPSICSYDFPPKKSIGKKDSALVEDRRQRLQLYLRKILAHWPELANCNSRFFLEQHLAFFKDQKESDSNKNSKSVFSPRRSGDNRNSDGHYTGL